MYSVVIFVLIVVGAVFASEEDVVELEDSDFNSVIAEYDIALVMFYTPSCGHCQRLKPEYAKAAGDLVMNYPPINLAKIDCSETGKETCKKHKISEYPTLKIFRDGVFWKDYEGPRVASAIVNYMKTQVGPASKELTNVEELEGFLKEGQDASVVGFFKKNTDLKAVFLQVADNLRGEVRFGHSSDKDVLNKQGTTNTIVLFRPLHLRNKYEQDSVIYSGDAVSSKIERFIRQNYHGLVDHRRIYNRHTFSLPLTVAYYGVDYMKNPKGTNYWRNRILKVAQQYKGKMNFAISSASEFKDELNKLGVGPVENDKVIIVTWKSAQVKYIMKDEFSADDLNKFVKSILDGNLKPYVKSEPIPESNDGPVKVAVAKNFDEVVDDNGMDTLIEFYVPWCGHCEAFAPTYEKLAQEFVNEDVVFVKMDISANDVPQVYEVKGVPTLYWAAKNSKSTPVKYEGERELDDFIKFIAKHATKELNGYDRNGNVKKTEL